MTRIPILCTNPWTWILWICGAPPDWCDIRIDANRVRVRMGVVFMVTFDRRDVVSVTPERTMVSIGVHGGGAAGSSTARTARSPVSVCPILRTAACSASACACASSS